MKKIFKILFCSFLLMALICAGFLTGTYIQVSKEALTRIEKGAIERIIFSESPVYYDDGVTPIGVYFEKMHSKYISYKDIPKNYIKALIASEDGNFFNHPGFDVWAILRAFIVNFRAGKVVQGGSTISQQTAKNIFKREKRTYRAKLKEFFQALLLEKKYTKEEIIEMYVNQFFVTGFGKGLMIAADYFFDKDARDLDLVESAFIAGFVKGPNMYNPFIKKSDKGKREAVRLSKIRKDYVLKNMWMLDLITEEQYTEAREREVPFKEGKVTYRLNVILDYIRGQLESDYFRSVLNEQGVDNIATSGIKIYTSIAKEIQEGALKSIRNHLPLLDVKVSGYDSQLFKERYIKNIGEIHRKPNGGLPFFCNIVHINNDSENPYLSVVWDGGEGTIHYEGFKSIGEAWLKWKLGEWAIFDKRHASDFLGNFHDGDLIPAIFEETTEKEPGNGEGFLALWQIPELEGGIIVLKNGMVKAMIGGFFDRYFNRAVDAKRQLGSIFKPLVYTAALQLKWNSLDPLVNMSDVFRFENTFYLPRPDHEPKSGKVSMAWAGVKSENIATVWLLYHLTDRLNMSEFRQVVERLGLDRKKDEPYNEYVTRIRDKHGVVVDWEAIMEAAFEETKKEIESDLIFSGHENVLDNLYRLHFNIDSEILDLRKKDDLQVSLNSFKRLRSLNFNMINRFNKIIQLIELHAKNTDKILNGALRELLGCFYLDKATGAGSRIIYSENRDQIDLKGLERIEPEWVLDRSVIISAEKVWIDNLIPSKIIELVQSGMNKNYKELINHKKYDMEILSKVKDFRTLVSLFYVKQLAKEMGISTWLDPVLSFPLGANSISILEAALSYSTILNGNLYSVNEDVPSTLAPIITKIEDREGETIWEYVPKPKKVLSSRISGVVTEILRMAVQEGTGRKAKDAVQLSMEFENGKIDIPIPSFGKTGTANRFTNSSFVGFIPGLNKETGVFDIHEGYVIASYVGYDDNRPMKGRHVAIYGASGALPLWIGTSNAIVNSQGYKKGLQAADLAFDIQPTALLNDRELKPVNVSPVTGLPTDGEGMPPDAIEVYSDVGVGRDALTLKRLLEPITGVNHEE